MAFFLRLHRDLFRARYGLLLAAALTTLACGSTSTESVTGPSAPKCTVSLSGPQAPLAADGGEGSVVVTTTPECTWTASADATWITDLTPSQGQGSGQVQFRASANTSGTARESTVTVNGQKASIRQDAAACQFDVDAPGDVIPAGGGAGIITITGPAGCAWTASSGATWISLSRASGSGDATLNFTVATNSGGTRSGQLTIAGTIVTVAQSSGLPGPAPSCTLTLQPTSTSVAAAGSPGTVAITANAGCAWTATSNAPWITVTPPAAGTGSGSLAFTVAANTGSAARVGNLTIGGTTFTVNQAGVAQTCTYNINPTSQSVGAGAQTGVSVGVTTAAGCAWTAASNAPWLTVTGGASGSGNGTVTLNVAANAGGARSGTATIAGRTFTVNQAAAAPQCTYSINPTSVTVGDRAVSGLTTAVTAGAGCAWTATESVPWLTITSGSSGSGNGTVTFRVDSFGGGAQSRTATMTIAGQTFTVTQVRCSVTLSPDTQSVGLLGGSNFTVSVTTPLGCTWKAKSNASWVIITGDDEGTGNGTVTYRVTANIGPSRTTTLEVEKAKLTVNQAGL